MTDSNNDDSIQADFMENDKPGSEDAVTDSSDRFDAADGCFAKSVTDLIDRIERTAFERHFSHRDFRRQLASTSDQSASQ